MSKKYMSRPPYLYGDIPDYTTPPMTVEEYQHYEQEFFGFLDDKKEPVEEGAGIFQRVLKFTGITKIPKYEDKYLDQVLTMNKINKDYLDGGSGDDFDWCLRSSKTSPIINQVVVTANQATQTDDIVTCDQEVQTVRPKRRYLKSLRRFFRRSFKCFKTEE